MTSGRGRQLLKPFCTAPMNLLLERLIAITLSYAVPHQIPFGFEMIDWKVDIFMFALVGYHCRLLYDPANHVVLPSATPGSQIYPVALS
jgi:hypothetical protein